MHLRIQRVRRLKFSLCSTALPSTADLVAVTPCSMAFLALCAPTRLRFFSSSDDSALCYHRQPTHRFAMSSSRELRRRLESVNSAEKLIDAMRLVAAARIRSSSQSALQTRPFAEKLQAMLASLIAAMERDGHDALYVAGAARSRNNVYAVLADDSVRIDAPAQKALLDRLYLAAAVQTVPIRAVCLVVIAADKGFCGTYNRDVISRAASRARFLVEQGMKVEIVTVGKIAGNFFKRHAPHGVTVRKSLPEGADTSVSRDTNLAGELCDTLLTSFIAGDTDRVEIVYTRFVSMLANAPSVRTLIPLTPSGIESLGDELFELTSTNGRFSTRHNGIANGNGVHHSSEAQLLSKLTIEPDEAALLLNAMLPMYVNSQVTRILRESLASEHASRMTAMSAATDNAREVAHALKVRYNKERQARVTKEIIEVSAHASMFA